MKKNKVKDSFLEQLKKIPIIAVACEKSGISRNTVYRWKNEDPKFLKKMEAALVEGEALVNDMGESQLLSLIREKNWPAISFWLKHRNPKFRERLELTTRIQDSGVLTPEQEAIVRQALNLAVKSVSEINQINTTNQNGKTNNPTGTDRPDDQRPESKNSNN